MTRLSSYPAITPRNKTLRQFKAALITITVFLGGCSTTMQMVVPSDISAASDVIAATDRSMFAGAMVDETFTLGEYKVTDVDRDWDISQSTGVSVNKTSLKSGSTEGGYAYQFKAPDGQFKGECATEVEEESLGMGGLKIEKKVFKLNCACTNGNSEVAKVTVQSKNMDDYTGTLTTSGQNYKVVSIKEIEGAISSIGVSGYRVDGDKPVGAAEVLKPGRIWLGRDLPPAEKSGLACTFVGLMLYLQPR